MPSGWLHCFCCMLPGSLGPSGDRKYWEILSKLFGRDRRKEETHIPFARHPLYIWVFWLLLQYGCFSEEQCFLHEWAPFMMRHQVVSVSSEGTAIPSPLAFSQCGSECSPVEISISLWIPRFSPWPLGKPPLQRVWSTGICLLCLFFLFLKYHLLGAFTREILKSLYKNRILFISSHLRNSTVQGYGQILRAKIT